MPRKSKNSLQSRNLIDKIKQQQHLKVLKQRMLQRQAQASPGQSSDKKQHLIQQIHKTRRKVSQLHELESEIKCLSQMVKCQKQKTSTSSGKGQGRMPNISRNSGLNSNKKIKIYELQKKLQMRNKQLKQQNMVFMAMLQKYQQSIQSVTKTNTQIHNERNQSGQLKRLQSLLQLDINRIQQKSQENRLMLKQQASILQMYQKQKIKKITEIKRLKRIVGRSTEETEPDQDAISQGQLEQDNQHSVRNSFRFQFSQTNSPQLISQNRRALKSPNNLSQKIQQQILLENYQSLQLQPFYISFKNKSKCIQSSSPRRQCKYNQKNIQNIQISPILLKSSQEKQHAKSLTQIQHIVYSLQQKIQKHTSTFTNQLQAISLVKRANKNLQASLKHTNTTLQLLSQKLGSLTKKNQQQSAVLLQYHDRCQKLNQKLRVKEGQRGQYRGKLGIKVENTRILSIINEGISTDFQRLNMKTGELRRIGMQIRGLLDRVLGQVNGCKDTNSQASKDYQYI